MSNLLYIKNEYLRLNRNVFYFGGGNYRDILFSDNYYQIVSFIKYLAANSVRSNPYSHGAFYFVRKHNNHFFIPLKNCLLLVVIFSYLLSIVGAFN